MDVSELRESIKGHMLLTMQEQTQSPQVDTNTFAGLGQVTAMGLVNRLIESLVSHQQASGSCSNSANPTS